MNRRRLEFVLLALCVLCFGVAVYMEFRNPGLFYRITTPKPVEARHRYGISVPNTTNVLGEFWLL